MVGISIYPDSIDTDAQLEHLIDNSSLVLASHINALRDSVFSIERAMGIAPFGKFDSLADRISNTDSAFLPLSGGKMAGNLNIQYSSSEIPSSVSIEEEVALTFDELSFYESNTFIDIGNKIPSTITETALNANSVGVPPFCVVGKNVVSLPNATSSLANSNRRKVRMYDDVHVVGDSFIEKFVRAPRLLLSKDVVPSNFDKPTGSNSSSVKSLIKGGIKVDGNLSAKHGMSYLGGVFIERWWSDPDYLNDDKVCEIGLAIPTDFFNQSNWQNILVFYSAEFRNENLLAQLYINHKVVSGPILYNKLSRARSSCNFAVFNKADFDGNFGWTESEPEKSYLEQLDGTFNTAVSSIGINGTNQYNDSTKNENKFWANTLSVGNCYGKDIINYVSSSSRGNKVIKISLKLAKHDFFFPLNLLDHSKTSVFQNTPSFISNVDNNLVEGSVLRPSCPDIRNIQIVAMAINDDGFSSDIFNLGGAGLINRPDLSASFNAVSNPAINPDAVVAH